MSIFAAAQAGVERRLIRALQRLPAALQRPVVARLEKHDRSDLDPVIRMLLALADQRKPLHALPLEKARRAYGQLVRSLDFNSRPMARLQDHHVDVDGRRLLVREYRARDSATLQPAVMFFHGGGFTIGSVADYQNFCCWLSDQLDMPVFSVDYRLAPEHAFPAWVEDVTAAWRWLTENAPELGVDQQRLGVMGDSAGANLATVTALQAAAWNLTRPAAQCLVYPTTDQRRQSASHSELGDGFALDNATMDFFCDCYLKPIRNIKDPRISPLLAKDLSGQPPAIVITCTDPLRDEGQAYADRLEDAGVAVTRLHYPQLVHSFVNMGGVVPAARAALVEICDSFGKMLGQPVE